MFEMLFLMFFLCYLKFGCGGKSEKKLNDGFIKRKLNEIFFDIINY